MAGLIKCFLFYWQSSAIVNHSLIEGYYAQRLVEALNILASGLSIQRLRCIIPLLQDNLAMYSLMMLLPLGLIAANVLVIVCGAAYTLRTFRLWNDAVVVAKIKLATVFMLYASFIEVLNKFVMLWSCQENHILHKSLVDDVPDLECLSTEWWKWFGVGALAVLFYCILPMVYIFYRVFANRTDIKKHLKEHLGAHHHGEMVWCTAVARCQSPSRFADWSVYAHLMCSNIYKPRTSMLMTMRATSPKADSSISSISNSFTVCWCHRCHSIFNIQHSASARL
jgi:hypothetical protein